MLIFQQNRIFPPLLPFVHILPANPEFYRMEGRQREIGIEKNGKVGRFGRENRKRTRGFLKQTT